VRIKTQLNQDRVWM